MTAPHCTATCLIFQVKSVSALFYTKMDEFLITLWSFKYAFQGENKCAPCCSRGFPDAQVGQRCCVNYYYCLTDTVVSSPAAATCMGHLGPSLASNG